ncbi:hypothetical protein DFJ74DRAFT_712595 [Hyaloraphidium curvatum]|nr:hypothetical protein DFJ74DRAFT_712595 [Hyaloraphidium curvatum]
MMMGTVPQVGASKPTRPSGQRRYDRAEDAPDDSGPAKQAAAWRAAHPPWTSALSAPPPSDPSLFTFEGVRISDAVAAADVVAAASEHFAAPAILPYHVLRFPAPASASAFSAHTSLAVASPWGPEYSYFEVEILALRPDRCVGVGVAPGPWPPFRFPGWDAGSIGYATTGPLHAGSRQGHKFAAPIVLAQGTVIGCGTKLVGGERAVFYTRDGRIMGSSGFGMAPNPDAGTVGRLPADPPLCAVVASDGSAVVAVNFGEAPFRWAAANGLAVRKTVPFAGAADGAAQAADAARRGSLPPPFEGPPPFVFEDPPPYSG